MAKLYVTLKELRKLGPCKEGYRKLMRNIEYDKTADEVRIPVELVLQVNGGCDADWLLCVMADDLDLGPGGLSPDEELACHDFVHKHLPTPEDFYRDTEKWPYDKRVRLRKQQDKLYEQECARIVRKKLKGATR